MRTFLKSAIAGASGLMALGFAAAFADYRPAYCDVDHDHRSHHAGYYNYYPADKYYRAGPYSGSGFSLFVRVGDGDGYYYSGRRRGYVARPGRIVHQESFDTRYRALIVLTEEKVYGPYGPRLICTVKARGPEARYVSKRRMHKIAYRNCSPRARIRVYA